MPSIIAREKAQAVKKNGLLEIIDTKESLESVGGLDVLKGWLLKRRSAFGKSARRSKRQCSSWRLPTTCRSCGRRCSGLEDGTSCSLWTSPTRRTAMPQLVATTESGPVVKRPGGHDTRGNGLGQRREVGDEVLIFPPLSGGVWSGKKAGRRWPAFLLGKLDVSR